MNAELDKQYSPSLWSKRFDAQGVIDDFYNDVTCKTRETQKEAKVERDIRYGPGEKMTLDVYSSEFVTEESPLLVFIHGGFWQEGSKECYGFFREFLRHGIRVIVPGYDLAPQVSLGEILDEMKELFRYLQKYASENKVKQVWLSGHSAGAQLAISMLQVSECKNPLISGFILISGIYFLGPVVHTSNNKLLKLTEEDADEYSPMNWKVEKWCVPKENLFFLMAVGQDESPAFLEQSAQYAQFLEKQDVRVKHITLSDCDHFNIVQKLYEQDFILTTLIIDHILKDNK